MQPWTRGGKKPARKQVRARGKNENEEKFVV
jgi:hypothetical protein